MYFTSANDSFEPFPKLFEISKYRTFGDTAVASVTREDDCQEGTDCVADSDGSPARPFDHFSVPFAFKPKGDQ